MYNVHERMVIALVKCVHEFRVNERVSQGGGLILGPGMEAARNRITAKGKEAIEKEKSEIRKHRRREKRDENKRTIQSHRDRNSDTQT